MGSEDGDAGESVSGTDTQRILFHVPNGASGTVDRSVAAGVDVGSAAGEAVAVADGDADADADADAVSVGPAAGMVGADPLAVAPTQPAAMKAVSATTALQLRHPRRLTNADSTACPPRRS
jgi:hypothetical protein